MGNGSVAVIGGDDTDFTTSAGEFAGDGRFSVRVFSSDKWVEVKSMSSPRWYPSVTTLADGSLIIVGGATVAQPNYSIPRSYDNPTYEYYPAKPSTQARQFPLYLDLLSWSFPYNLYPSVFQTPSGHVFIFSSNKTIMLNPRDESITFLPDMPALDHRPWIYPFTPTSFILPMTKANNYAFTIMICGGTTNNDNYDASPLCLSISPNTANPIWTQTDPMPIPRVMPDSVLLPDGTVLITNGLQRGMAGGGYQGNCAAASIPIYQAVLYIPANPAGRRWKTLAAAQNKRLYHSGALLLESGHAVSFGSEMDNYDDYYGDPSVRDSCWPVAYTACKSPFNYNIEVFSPPYLSTSTGSSKRRSIVITQAPESVVYSSILSISFTNKSRVDRFSFVRRGSCTHQLNTDQRLIELEAAQLSCRIILDSADTTVCEASIPIWFSSGMAPPGSWFLFAIDGEGVPSVAKTIMLSQSKSIMHHDQAMSHMIKDML